MQPWLEKLMKHIDPSSITTEEQLIAEVVIQSIWQLRSASEDPFPPKETAPVFIREVKEGWVRFQVGDGKLFADERMEIKRFIAVYKPTRRVAAGSLA